MICLIDANFSPFQSLSMLSFNRLKRQKLIIASFSLRELCPNTELFLVHCSANQWTGFYMITVSVMKELKEVGNNVALKWLWCNVYLFNLCNYLCNIFDFWSDEAGLNTSIKLVQRVQGFELPLRVGWTLCAHWKSKKVNNCFSSQNYYDFTLKILKFLDVHTW